MYDKRSQTGRPGIQKCVVNVDKLSTLEYAHQLWAIQMFLLLLILIIKYYIFP